MMTSEDAQGRPDGHAHLIASWQRLSAQLGPLIGDNGFCALFGRACRLAGPEYGWLTATPACKSCAAQVGALDATFASVAPEQAEAAHAVLLRTFTGLLAALIGPALATRLVDAALLDGKEQNAQEHK